jgi:hypothetical protein
MTEAVCKWCGQQLLPFFQKPSLKQTCLICRHCDTIGGHETNRQGRCIHCEQAGTRQG